MGVVARQRHNVEGMFGHGDHGGRHRVRCVDQVACGRDPILGDVRDAKVDDDDACIEIAQFRRLDLAKRDRREGGAKEKPER